jgi:lysophospholipase L1-like esterase
MEHSESAGNKNRNRKNHHQIGSATADDHHGRYGDPHHKSLKDSTSLYATLDDNDDDVENKKYQQRWHQCGQKKQRKVVTAVVCVLSVCIVAIITVARTPTVSDSNTTRGSLSKMQLKEIRSPLSERRTEAVPQAQKKQIKIACVGDSLTRGDIGRDITNGIDDYPTQLQQLLLQKNSSNAAVDVVVGNFGKNGATALRGVPASYDRTKEFRDAKAFQPDIVLLGLGTNDAKFLWSPELRAKHSENIVASFSWLVNEFSKDIHNNHRPKVFLARRPPFIAKDFQKIQQDNVVNFLHPLLDRVVSNATLAATVDLQEATMNNYGDIFINDGLHLNHQGYGLVAEAWINELVRSGVVRRGGSELN